MKRKIVTLLVITGLMISMLTACDNSQKENEVSFQEEAESAAIGAVQTKEKEAGNTNAIINQTTIDNEGGVSAMTDASDSTLQPPSTTTTPEPTPEVVVYEGIDMESTLPGKEWVHTFVGIIDEPKLVVFNDETNKKVIVEHQQEFEFEEGDTLAFFVPKKFSVMGCLTEKNTVVEFLKSFNYAEVTFDESSCIVEDTITAPVYYNDERIDDLVYYLKPVE